MEDIWKIDMVIRGVYMMPYILIVEDDIDASRSTKEILEQHGYETACAYNCSQALQYITRRNVDLILLDMILPDSYGEDLCRRIRATSTCPIIFLSGLNQRETICSALECGGDDYLVKPADGKYLLAKVKACLRRVRDYCNDEKEISEAVWRFQQFYIVPNQHRVMHTGTGKKHEIELSPTEYQLLLHLIRNQNHLVLYNDLYQSIWEAESLGDVRTVMVHISNLRKKLDLMQTGMITTVRGAGYLFCDV